MTGEPMTDAELAKMSGRLAEYADDDVYSIFARDMRRIVAEVSEWRRVRIRYPADEPLPNDPDQYAAVPVFALEKRLAEIEAERDAERSRADTAEAERDAAVARAMPGWRYLATWDAVNTVEARHNDEPAPGLYAVWKPGWPYPSAASVQFGVFATDEESPAPDDYLLGAWISGPLPLPDIPTPTAAQEG